MIMLHEAIRQAIATALRGVCVGMPGRLESYDPDSGRGSVKPLIQEPDAAGVLQSIKPIASVPVVMPGGAQASLYMPPKIGDTGWISFGHRSLEIWLDRGGDTPPGDPRVLDLSDAVFWPGLRPFSEGSFAEEPDALVLRNGDTKIKILDGKVAIGNPHLPMLPSVPPLTGKVELMNLIDQFLTLLTNVSAGAVIAPGVAGVLSPTFAASVIGIQANLAQLKGSL